MFTFSQYPKVASPQILQTSPKIIIIIIIIYNYYYKPLYFHFFIIIIHSILGTNALRKNTLFSS